MSYSDFYFSQKTELIFGDHILENLVKKVEQFKVKKLFILTGDIVLPIVEEIVQELSNKKIDYLLRSNCTPNPRDIFVNLCAKEVLESHCDFILGIGGGSVIDASKATALLATNDIEKGIWPYITYQEIARSEAMPLGLIVTIPSTGSESNASCVINNDSTKEKLIYTNDMIRPRFSMVNPKLTYTLNAWFTSCGVTDIFSHLIEQYLHNDQHTEVSDNMTLGVMKAVVKWGKISIIEPCNYDARANLMWASFIAMNRILAVGHSENWISHFIEHALSAQYNVQHGAGMAIVLPRYLDSIACFDNNHRLITLGQVVFQLENNDTDVSIKEIRKFFQELGMPLQLSDMNITMNVDDIATLAQKALPYGDVLISGYPAFTQMDAENLIRKMK